jgi:hypothetical protein
MYGAMAAIDSNAGDLVFVKSYLYLRLQSLIL